MFGQFRDEFIARGESPPHSLTCGLELLVNAAVRPFTEFSPMKLQNEWLVNPFFD